MSKHRHTNVSWCDGYNYSRHPTDRRLREVTAFRGTPDEITIELCPDCLESFYEEVRRTKAVYDEAGGSQ